MYRLGLLLLLESKFDTQLKYPDWGDTFSNQMNLIIICFKYPGYSEYKNPGVNLISCNIYMILDSICKCNIKLK